MEFLESRLELLPKIGRTDLMRDMLEIDCSKVIDTNDLL